VVAGSWKIEQGSVHSGVRLWIVPQRQLGTPPYAKLADWRARRLARGWSRSVALALQPGGLNLFAERSNFLSLRDLTQVEVDLGFDVGTKAQALVLGREVAWPHWARNTCLKFHSNTFRRFFGQDLRFWACRFPVLRGLLAGTFGISGVCARGKAPKH
jgi:hypothetical protein